MYLDISTRRVSNFSLLWRCCLFVGFDFASPALLADSRLFNSGLLTEERSIKTYVPYINSTVFSWKWMSWKCLSMNFVPSISYTCKLQHTKN